MVQEKYDVFLSYAHADAQSDEQKRIVRSIKETIDQALQSVVEPDSCVFLDSEALKWGDEWNTKICESIDKARVFVYLLSPNYLKSNYCQREKLWWARREMRLGRLNKATRPIYFIELPKTDDSEVEHYKSELLICQANSKPFFMVAQL